MGERIEDILECSKYIASDRTINSALAKIIFNEKKKNEQYFDPINIQSFADVYLEKCKTILNETTLEVNSKPMSITCHI